MGKTKDSNLAVLDPVDTVKPVVKEFVDRDMEVRSFILSRLSHVPRSTVVLKKVYQSKDEQIYRYRVNYHTSDHSDGQLVPNNRIVASRYVEVVVGDEMEFIDKT